MSAACRWLRRMAWEPDPRLWYFVHGYICKVAIRFQSIRRLGKLSSGQQQRPNVSDSFIIVIGLVFVVSAGWTPQTATGQGQAVVKARCNNEKETYPWQSIHFPALHTRMLRYLYTRCRKGKSQSTVNSTMAGMLKLLFLLYFVPVQYSTLCARRSLSG